MKNIILFIMGLVFAISPAYAYEKPNHSKINEAAVGVSQVDHVLKNYLGFTMGLDITLYGYEEKDKMYKKLRILQWIGNGGEYEDSSGRYINHFHDPLKNWRDAGLKDLGDSALLWAQQGQESFFNSFGEWTWNKARQNFYDALTSKSPSYMHERFWAKCFRGLGQLMHLVSDMSVPAHTRNDVHILPRFGIGRWHYETWCLNNIDRLSHTATAGDFPESSVLLDPQPEPGYEHLVPITSLFDRNQYTGSAPLTGTNIGLAEYSNANFYSKDTIWSFHYKYPEYDYNNLHCEDVTIDGKTYKKRYHKNMHANIQHLSVVSRLWYEAHRSPIPPDLGDDAYLTFLDEKCWEEYASKLVPRAIGYSAALLNYFFRGRLEITPPDRYLYGIADPATKQFSEIRLKLRNTTPDEEMGAGELTAVMKYRLPLNPDFDPVATAPFDTDYVDYDDPDNYAYSVSEPIQVGIISADNPQEFTFTFNDPVPTNALDLSLMVVYRGELGLEQDAVVAQYKDLCEPHHLLFWNATDYCCLNGTLYTPSEITASPELSRQLDTDGNGKPDIYYFASPVNIYITFAGSTPVPEPTETSYTLAFHNLLPRNYGEVVVVQDQDTYYCSTLWNVIDSSPEDFPGFDFYWYLPDEEFPGHRTYFAYQIDHETDQMGNDFFNYQPHWHRLVPITFRGIPMQNGPSFYFGHPYEVKCEDADWPDAPDAQTYPPVINR